MSDGDRCSVLVAAIGNPDRGDDGVGPAIADRLRDLAPAGVRVIACGGDVLDLIEEWAGYAAALLIDAANPDGEPGRIRRFDLAEQKLAADFSTNSTHAFGLAEAVELARAMGRLPRRLAVYLVEGERFEIGAALTPPVAAAVDKAAEAILAELSRIAAAGAD